MPLLQIGLHVYDPSNNNWSYVTSIPDLPENHVLKDFAIVSVSNSLYIIGGRLCKKERTQNAQYGRDEFFDRDIDVMSLVLRYDFNSNQWSKCAPLMYHVTILHVLLRKIKFM